MSDKTAYISEALVSDKFGWTEEVINEGENGPIKAMILEGEFQRAGEPNRNKRIYSEELLGRETGRLQKFIKERNSIPMGMDHPLPGEDPSAMALIQRMGMENTCALCTMLEMHGNVVYGKAKVVQGDFGAGDKLAALVRNGFKPGVSSRGMGGKPNYNPQGFVMVPEDYQMITYDFVSQPSTFNAILKQRINEEIEFYAHNTKPETSGRKLFYVLKEFDRKYRGR